MDTFDLSSYELQDTATLKLKNARGDDDLLGKDGEPVTVEIYGPGSEPGRKAQFRLQRATNLRTMRGLRGENDTNDQIEAEKDAIEKLVTVTKSFSANFPVAPRDVYSNPKLYWIGKQVDEFFNKPGNFSRGPSAS